MAESTNETYDSTQDTLEHIDAVRSYMAKIIEHLRDRAVMHDASKLQSPEKEAFDRATPRLRDLEYGSEKYKAALADLGDALAHHYAHNTHHPEHHANGIAGMTLLDLIEAFADWKAASERHADGNFERSLQIQRERFGVSDQLASIFENTRRELGW